MLPSVKFDELGREIPDTRRVSLPASPPVSLADQVRALVAREFSRQAEAQGFESFEEADDFGDEDDDSEFVTPYTVVQMGQEALDGDFKEDLGPPPGPELKPPVVAEKAVSGDSPAAPPSA